MHAHASAVCYTHLPSSILHTHIACTHTFAQHYTHICPAVYYTHTLLNIAGVLRECAFLFFKLYLYRTRQTKRLKIVRYIYRVLIIIYRLHTYIHRPQIPCIYVAILNLLRTLFMTLHSLLQGLWVYLVEGLTGVYVCVCLGCVWRDFSCDCVCVCMFVVVTA